MRHLAEAAVSLSAITAAASLLLILRELQRLRSWLEKQCPLEVRCHIESQGNVLALPCDQRDSPPQGISRHLGHALQGISRNHNFSPYDISRNSGRSPQDIAHERGHPHQAIQAGFAIFVYRDAHWCLEADLSAPGCEASPPTIPGSFDGQVVRKESHFRN